MNKIVSVTICYLSVFGSITAQEQTTQEKLGYPKNTKLLIIHADDLGVAHSENAATLQALERGAVNSGSIMVPCPWFPEIAAYAKANPNADLGLHLTLTSEWKHYKWGPVLPASQVPSLVDENGFLYDNVADFLKHAKQEEVEKELRAQVERAVKFGINPTHFDAHMAGAFATAALLKIYLKLGHDYKVPVLLHREAFKGMFNIDLDEYVTAKDIVLDGIFMALPGDYEKGMGSYYSGVLKNLSPGLNCILLHAAFDDREMKAVTIDHPDYGAAWRQADLDFFMSEDCRELLKENKIQLITWREIRDKLVRGSR